MPESGLGRGSRWGTAGASFRYPQFRWVYLSNTAFFFAMNGQFVVRGYLAFQITRSPFALGLTNLAVAIPMLVLSPLGGVITDRFDRRRLILIGQGVLLCNEIGVWILILTGWLEYWHLFVAIGVMGCMFPVIMPARQAVVVTIVGRDGLTNAMALQQGGMNTARVVGPVMGGFLISIVGVRGAYLWAIVLYAVALLGISRIHPSRADSGPARSVLADMREGFSYVWNDRPVRALLFLAIIPPFLSMPFQSLLVVFADEEWGVGARGLGVLQAFAGVGGVTGSIAMAFMGEPRRRLRLMISTLLGFSGTLFLFALSPWFLLALPLVLIADVFVALFQTANGTAIQALIPDSVRGRVMSLMMMTFGLTPLGTVPVAAVAQVWGAPVAVSMAAVITGALAVAAYTLSKSLRSIDATVRERPGRFENPAIPGRAVEPAGLPGR